GLLGTRDPLQWPGAGFVSRVDEGGRCAHASRRSAFGSRAVARRVYCHSARAGSGSNTRDEGSSGHCMTAESVCELSGAVASRRSENATRWQSAARWVRHEGIYALLSCWIPLICIVLANPSAKAGFIDDWSYSHI